MNRLLLLVPVLALVLMGCPPKHATGTPGPTPAQPDPNAYHTSPEPNTAVDDQPAQGNISIGVSSGSSGSGNSNSDTVVTNVSMPDTAVAVKADSSKLERLVVSFISKGEGTDRDGREKLDKYLAKHPDVKYRVHDWGREGEVDYVILIKDRNAIDQQSVVKDVRNAVGGRELVLIQEWVEPHAPRPSETVTEVPDSNIVRLVVSFISKGEGTDHATRDAFDKWLTEKNVTWEITNWGREGETNYCFRLTNMDSRQQEIFVRDVRTFMADKELVLVNEYAPCDKRK